MILREFPFVVLSGEENMSLDLKIAQHCKPDEVYIRFYGWNPYCVSLGAHQSSSDLNEDMLLQHGYTWVKRPTGGRAILHAEEITYSVVTNISNGFTPHQFYEMINDALKSGLYDYNPLLVDVEKEQKQVDFKKFYQSEPSSTACFASTAKNELKVHGKKLVGSAQRKLSNTLLQHGSVLVGKKHREIVDFLNLNEEQKQKLINELDEKTIEIESILGEKVDYTRLYQALKQSLEKSFGLEAKLIHFREVELWLKEN